MSDLYSNIPLELRVLKQFVLWRYEDVGAAKPAKIPYQPSGQRASVTDSNTWSTFDSVLKHVGSYSGIGFVFSDHDPYSGIDLDDPSFLADGVTPNPNYQIDFNRQIKIAHEFDSYSELSPSGKGLHIIIKGKVPDGKRTNYIELYPHGRYFTMTGNVHNNKPIADHNELLNTLWAQMGGVNKSIPTIVTDTAETEADDIIVARASNAVNGEKFLKLHNGDWLNMYPTQSEADYAYIDMLAFYTQNRAQITRIFKNSALMRDKANKRKTYLSSMVNNAFDRIPDPINFDKLQEQFELKFPKDKGNIEPVVVANPSTPTTIPIPPGLLGEIAQFIYQASPRPVPEISLAAAIGLMAGITGRAYNISGTGLNQYVLVLAKTGRGKEAAASGIDKLMNSIKMQVPTSSRFRGPGIINSGQALTKYLHTTSNCFVSVLGEFGITIDRISNPYANSADKMLYSNLLDLYNKSGHGQTFQPAIYSKKEDSVGMTESPAVTILGESTHKLFYETLNEGMIAAGLLPRFIIIEYNGYRVPSNENHHTVQPSFLLQERFAALVAQCETIMASPGKVINVASTESAWALLKAFDKNADNKINSSTDDVIAELWNRAHMKVMRLSAMIAVGVNTIEPIIIDEYVQWSINLIQNDIKLLSSKFEAGEIGKHFNESKQVKEIIRMIRDFYNRDWEYISKYTKEKLMFDRHVIPYAYINKRLSGTLAFNDGRVKASLAIQGAIQVLINTDKIRELGHLDLKTFDTKQKCYVVKDMDILDDQA